MVKDRLSTISKHANMLADSLLFAFQETSRVSGLPARNVVIAAAATPVRADYRPDGELLLARCRDLLAEGCDGIALFGTTGEGVAFTVADRQEILERFIAGGLDPGRLIVSVGALSL